MFKVVASKPVAHDSPDHHWNGGSTQNSYTNENFNSRLYEIISEGAFITDWGCAGGGFINNCIRDGYFAIGLEGDDRPLKQKFSHWATLAGTNLFTCDVTEDFQIFWDNEPVKFDVITSWEFLEHPRQDKIDNVMLNVVKHIKFNMCSIFQTHFLFG